MCLNCRTYVKTVIKSLSRKCILQDACFYCSINPLMVIVSTTLMAMVKRIKIFPPYFLGLKQLFLPAWQSCQRGSWATAWLGTWPCPTETLSSRLPDPCRWPLGFPKASPSGPRGHRRGSWQPCESLALHKHRVCLKQKIKEVRGRLLKKNFVTYFCK